MGCTTTSVFKDLTFAGFMKGLQYCRLFVFVFVQKLINLSKAMVVVYLYQVVCYYSSNISGFTINRWRYNTIIIALGVHAFIGNLFSSVESNKLSQSMHVSKIAYFNVKSWGKIEITKKSKRITITEQSGSLTEVTYT